MRRWVVASCSVLLLSLLAVWGPASAAATFADPAFQTQWQQGEAIAPNFWGPLANAKDGKNEPYKEAQDGQRLVQYFDKGRMELTNGAVTNGLLATELIKGQMQVGDAAFQPKPPPAIPIAGDPDNPGPTYAGLAAKGQQVLATTTDSSNRGAATYSLSAAGDVLVNPKPGNQPDAYTFTVYDAPTGHNVAKSFADYRAQVGLATIGYAISEPFVAVVKVAGQQRTVLVQVFERRVVTYTADNPSAFQVEMGNIGQHYYQWRYGSVSPTQAPQAAPTGAAPPVPTTATPIATAIPTAASGTPAAANIMFTTIQGSKPGNLASVTIQTAPNATCGIRYSAPKGSGGTVQGLSEKTADAFGYVTWTFLISSNTTTGTGSVTVTCNNVSRTASLVIG